MRCLCMLGAKRVLIVVGVCVLARAANGAPQNALAGAGETPDAADVPKSQCYTSRTIHVVYPQQAGRR